MWPATDWKANVEPVLYDSDVVDALLDHQQDVKRDVQARKDIIELLRESLAECLAKLPDNEWSRYYQEVYVITDPECLSEFYELFANLSGDTEVDEDALVV